jgi:hypothetical protein
MYFYFSPVHAPHNHFPNSERQMESCPGRIDSEIDLEGVENR